MKFEKFYRTLLWVGVIILIITMFISGGLRLDHLWRVNKTGVMPVDGSIEYGYASYPFMTILHILPGTVFLVLGMFQFSKTFRTRHFPIHRLLGKIYILLGLLVGVTAIIMGFLLQFGGYIESAAVVVFGSYFLFALIYAYRHIRNGNYILHREWMIRGYALGLAVATMRPIIGLFFAFTDINFADFFGVTFWIAFLLHALVAEWWIRYTRRSVMVT